MSSTHGPSCPPSGTTGIAIAVHDSEIRMVRCSGCDEQWWERDGARVPLPELLPLLRASRNAPRAATPRRGRRPEESPVAAAARAAAVELATSTTPEVVAQPAARPTKRAPVTVDPVRSESDARRAAAERARVVEVVDLTATEEQEGSLLFRQLLALQERSPAR